MGLWLNKSESKNDWMQVLDELLRPRSRDSGKSDIFLRDPTPDTKFDQIHSCKGIQTMYVKKAAFEVLCKELEAFRSGQSMEAQFRAYRAVMRSWPGSKTGDVCEQRDRSDKLQL